RIEQECREQGQTMVIREVEAETAAIINGEQEHAFDMQALGRAARLASRKLATLPARVKNTVLIAIADALEADAATVLAANEEDIAAARARDIAPSMLDRLLLNSTRIAALARDARNVAA